MQAAQICVVGLHIRSARGSQALMDLLRKRKPDFTRNRTGNIALDPQNITEFPVIAVAQRCVWSDDWIS